MSLVVLAAVGGSSLNSWIRHPALLPKVTLALQEKLCFFGESGVFKDIEI